MNHEKELALIQETIDNISREYISTMLEKIPVIKKTGKMDPKGVAKVAINISTLVERRDAMLNDFKEAYEALDLAREHEDELTDIFPEPEERNDEGVK